MLPRSWWLHSVCSMALLLSSASVLHAQARAASSEDPIIANGLGKGTISLDGPWQFHVGDDMAWTNPRFDDSAWEQLTADKPWGEQKHFAYAGFAWYRLRIKVSDIGDSRSSLALFILRLDDAYEVYWNGILVGRNGSMPPHASWNLHRFNTTVLGQVQSGIVAFRVWKAPLLISSSGFAGGFTEPPHLGLSKAIATHQEAQSNLIYLGGVLHFILLPFYLLAAVLSLMAWLREREQSAYLWMFIFCSAVSMVLLQNCGIDWPASVPVLTAIRQALFAVRDIALWYLLLWLLELSRSRVLIIITRTAVVILLSALGLHAYQLNSGWNGCVSDFVLTAFSADRVRAGSRQNHMAQATTRPSDSHKGRG